MPGVQIPYLPSTFDMEALLKAYEAGTSIRQRQQQLDETSAEHKLRAKQFEHQMKLADLESKLAAHRAKGDLVDLLGKIPGKSGDEQHQPINMGLPEFGIPDISITPQSLDEIVAGLLNKKQQEADIDVEKTRAGNEVALPPGMAAQFGLPEGMTSLPKELITKLEQSVALPDAMGGGTAPKSAAELIKSVFTEKGANARNAASNATTMEAARIRADASRKAAVADDPDIIASMAQQVATGQIKSTNVPVKMRPAVLSKLEKEGTAIPDPEFLKKIDQFGTAQSMLDSFNESLATFKNAKGLMDSTKALAQVDAERKAFSRLIGRSLGEKGVFTEADKQDFINVMGTNTPTLVLAPTWSEDRTNRLQKIMDRVRSRSISELEKRTGAKYREGGRAENKADTAPDAAAAPTGPKLGDTKKFKNGNTGRWDGKGWVLVQ